MVSFNPILYYYSVKAHQQLEEHSRLVSCQKDPALPAADRSVGVWQSWGDPFSLLWEPSCPVPTPSCWASRGHRPAPGPGSGRPRCSSLSISKPGFWDSYFPPSTAAWVSEHNLEVWLLECAVLSHSVVSNSLRPHELWPTRLLCPCGFSRQEYWSELPCPPAGHLPNPEIEPRSPALQVDSLLSEPPGKPQNTVWVVYPSPGDCPNPGIEPGTPALQADSLPAELSGKLPLHSVCS